MAECIVVLWVVPSSIRVIAIAFLKICSFGMITYLLNRKKRCVIVLAHVGEDIINKNT